MNFIQFASANGVLIDNLYDDDRIHRCGTQKHPRSKSGAYRFGGDWGWVHAWDESDKPEIWFDARTTPESKVAIKRDMTAQMQDEAKKRQAAAQEASEIIKLCRLGTHPYLDRKGFKGEEGLIDFDGRLVIPMRDCQNYKRVNSLQWINGDGEKKFMTGGKAKGSIFKIGSGAEIWLCEGYATGLSIRKAAERLYRQVTVVVCFSASNLSHVASLLQGRRFVMADNDASKTGQTFAEKTGLQYVMPPEIGMDANDLHQRHGLDALSGLMKTCR